MRELSRRMARLMAMDERTWKRHATAASGWSRVVVLPWITAAALMRDRIGSLWLAALAFAVLFVWLNPRLFPDRGSNQGWMSRAVRAERLWIEGELDTGLGRFAQLATVLSGIIALGFALWLYGLAVIGVWISLAGMVITMSAKFALLEVLIRWASTEPDKAAG